MEESLKLIIPLVLGYLLDLLFGDPYTWPHPVKLFGNLISAGEGMLNKGRNRFAKGMLMSIVLCLITFLGFYFLMANLMSVNSWLFIAVASIFVFFGLANRNLIQEGEAVFNELQSRGLEAGRKRLSWIVGRDTSKLSAQQIRTAVFETMSENLSDGVIAPLFFYLLAGVPGMMAYKMINTLDSMIGYRNERYEHFGKFAARLDDVANFIPARLTAFLMVLVSLSLRGLHFIFTYGNKHKSPNSGYPEAALAGIIDVRFGGPNTYHGVIVEKPYIGSNTRKIEHSEIKAVTCINHKTTLIMLLLIAIIVYFRNF